MRILIAGGSRLSRGLLNQLLESLPDVNTCYTIEDEQDALSQCAALQPELVLVDMRGDRAESLALARNLIQQAPKVRLVLLTESGKPMAEELGGNISACLSDSLTLDQFVEALRATAHTCPDSKGSWQILSRDMRRTEEPQALNALSPRELEVLELLAEGMGNREIGEKLFVSEFTVKAHLRRIYRKLGINGRAKACLFAAGHISHGMDRRIA